MGEVLTSFRKFRDWFSRILTCTRTPEVTLSPQSSLDSSVKPDRFSNQFYLRRCQSAPTVLESNPKQLDFSGQSSFFKHSDISQTTYRDDDIHLTTTPESTIGSMSDCGRLCMSSDILSTKRDFKLDYLVSMGMLTKDEALLIEDFSDQYLKHGLLGSCCLNQDQGSNNFICLGDGLSVGNCFLDFLNFGSEKLLEDVNLNKFKISISKTKVDKDNNLCTNFDETFFSFCVGRTLSSNDYWHCQLCHCCRESNFKHCQMCNRCSFGLKIGNRCEHCDFKDAGFQENASSVGSFSELIDA